MGQRKADEGKYTVNSFQYPCRRWVCLHAQRLDRSIDDFCADNHNYFQFKLKGKRRSAGRAFFGVQRHPCRDAEADSHGGVGMREIF